MCRSLHEGPIQLKRDTREKYGACKQNELLVFVQLLEVLGQCSVIRLVAFAVSKDDHLLDPYAQAN